MRDKRLSEMKREYESIPIPPQLRGRVNRAIEDAKQDTALLSKKRSRLLAFRSIALHFASAAAAVLLLITVMANSGESIAYAMEDIPFLGAISRVVTFREYSDSQENMEANVKVPQVTVEDTSGNVLDEASADLNQQIEDYTSQIIEAYEESVESSGGEGHLAMNLDYQVITDNDRIFALRFDQQLVMAGSQHSVQIFNLDKTTGTLLSLGDLFQEGCDYITPISDNIKEQMTEQMAQDEDISYFYNTDTPGLNFTAIRPNENFYISEEGTLTLVFDKYEIAPGYMGSVEFEIPTEVIADIVKDGFVTESNISNDTSAGM